MPSWENQLDKTCEPHCKGRKHVRCEHTGNLERCSWETLCQDTLDRHSWERYCQDILESRPVWLWGNTLPGTVGESGRALLANVLWNNISQSQRAQNTVKTHREISITACTEQGENCTLEMHFQITVRAEYCGKRTCRAFQNLATKADARQPEKQGENDACGKHGPNLQTSKARTLHYQFGKNIRNSRKTRKTCVKGLGSRSGRGRGSSQESQKILLG